MLKRFGLTGIGGRLAAVVGLFAVSLIAVVAALCYINSTTIQQALEFPSSRRKRCRFSCRGTIDSNSLGKIKPRIWNPGA